jgi:hypothetical protein
MGEMNSIREKGDECLVGFENNLKTQFDLSKVYLGLFRVCLAP